MVKLLFMINVCITKNYGKRLLNALPVFPIEQPEIPKKQ